MDKAINFTWYPQNLTQMGSLAPVELEARHWWYFRQLILSSPRQQLITSRKKNVHVSCDPDLKEGAQNMGIGGLSPIDLDLKWLHMPSGYPFITWPAQSSPGADNYSSFQLHDLWITSNWSWTTEINIAMFTDISQRSCQKLISDQCHLR